MNKTQTTILWLSILCSVLCLTGINIQNVNIFRSMLFSKEPTKITQPEDPNITFHNECLYPTVLIAAANDEYAGTGVVVRSEKIGEKYRNVAITCAHVITCEQKFTHRNWRVRVSAYIDSLCTGYLEYNCIVYGFDNKSDLAVVLFESDYPIFTAELDFRTNLYIGNEIFKIGHGGMREARLDYGRITSLSHEMYRSSAFTIPGDSGGPVFRNNKVIGITHAMDQMQMGPDNVLTLNQVSFLIPIRKLLNLDKVFPVKFVYDKKEPLPVSPFIFHEFNSYIIK